MSVKPFSIAIPDAVLADLRARIAATRWPAQLAGTGWDYGADTSYLRELVATWGGEFDWRARERELNRFEHVLVEVDGLRLHAARIRGTGRDPIPVLALHGWPGSFIQMLELAELLAAGEPSFTVIAPSLPGFGFSDPATRPGMSVSAMAELFVKLMAALGHSRFGARGGDLGAGVINEIAIRHPDRLIGVHTGGTNPFVMSVPEDLTADEKRFVSDAQKWMQSEMAYAMLQSTKPQTVAHALNDSPAGLAAWIIEKFWRWSDHRGSLERSFSRDELLTNLTIYWATESIGPSMRAYFETVRDPGGWGRTKVPTAYLMSPRDMFATPRSWVARTSTVTRWTEIDRGGHFLEWEEPELVADDMRAFFRTL